MKKKEDHFLHIFLKYFADNIPLTFIFKNLSTSDKKFNVTSCNIYWTQTPLQTKPKSLLRCSYTQTVQCSYVNLHQLCTIAALAQVNSIGIRWVQCPNYNSSFWKTYILVRILSIDQHLPNCSVAIPDVK